MGKRTIALASDHAGYQTKQEIIAWFEQKNIPYADLGCYSDAPCDYPDFAHAIADAVNDGKYPAGITFCGTGQGINMTANKHQKIRSALCWNAEIAKLARQHNDANICAIPGRFVTAREAVEIVEIFLSTDFEGGRHQRRIDKIPLKICR
ncbi:MAG: ribose 5-phosphate isomerase B [Prolixibacteraceae bacterium]|nr:ribose 5-phosphate isomerase B [Prolixibacteraceae bacterium]